MPFHYDNQGAHWWGKQCLLQLLMTCVFWHFSTRNSCCSSSSVGSDHPDQPSLPMCICAFAAGSSLFLLGPLVIDADHCGPRRPHNSSRFGGAQLGPCQTSSASCSISFKDKDLNFLSRISQLLCLGFDLEFICTTYVNNRQNFKIVF